VCGKPGHPPSPNYCPLVRAIKTNKNVHDKLKASIATDSDNSSSKSSKKKPPKTKPSKHGNKNKSEKKELIKEVTEAVLATLSTKSSDSSETDDSSATSSSQFHMFQHGADQVSASDHGNSRSATGIALAQPSNIWTIVPPKKHKHHRNKTTNLHRSKPIIMQNNLTGAKRQFRPGKHIKDSNYNSFSSLDDYSDDDSIETASY
jgi:hypothetical protein